MSDEPFCLECGSDNVTEETSPVTHYIGERAVHVQDDHHMVCSDCGETSYPGQMLGDSMRVIAGHIRREDGLMSAEDLINARMDLQLSTDDMDAKLNLAAGHWARLERGKVVQSPLVDRSVRELVGGLN